MIAVSNGLTLFSFAVNDIVELIPSVAVTTITSSENVVPSVDQVIAVSSSSIRFIDNVLDCF